MEDHQVRSIVSSSLAFGIIVITIILRFISRGVVLGTLFLDDWLMLAGGFLGAVFAIGDIVMVQHGYGRHLKDLSLEELVFIGKMLLSTEIIYHLAIAFAKWSMLVFLLRFIPEMTLSRKIALTTIWILMIYPFVTILTLLLQCIPLDKLWNPTLPGTCIDLEIFFYFGATFNIVTDFIIFVLPIKWLVGLKRSNSEKYLVLGIFGFSLFGCVVGIIRLYTIEVFASQQADFSYSIYGLDIWSHIEVVIAIVCGSAPALKPLFNRTPSCLRRQSISNLEMPKSFYTLNCSSLPKQTAGTACSTTLVTISID